MADIDKLNIDSIIQRLLEGEGRGRRGCVGVGGCGADAPRPARPTGAEGALKWRGERRFVCLGSPPPPPRLARPRSPNFPLSPCGFSAFWSPGAMLGAAGCPLLLPCSSEGMLNLVLCSNEGMLNLGVFCRKGF